MLTSGVGSSEFAVASTSEATSHIIDGIRVISVNAGYNDPRYGTTISGLARLWHFYRFPWATISVSKKLAFLRMLSSLRSRRL